MLGEQIGSGQGKRTYRRVVAVQPALQVEVSFEDATKLLGLDGINIGTYVSTTRADGTLAGEGLGAFATADGIATWKGLGSGQLKPGGAVSYRGSLTFSTASPKLARLNLISAVFEFEVDAAGNTQTKMWEWK